MYMAISNQDVKPDGRGLLDIPTNYPGIPTPGKLQLLWESNYKKLYHKLSPYTDHSTGVIKGFSSEPFLYDYPDEVSRSYIALRSAVPGIIGSEKDIIRTSKFLASGRGIQFIATQFLLQTGNSFNETRIWNPTSPIVAAGMGLTLGTMRPQRAFDTSGGIIGIARTLIGNSIPDAIFGAPKINKPSGTAPDTLIGSPVETTGGKGVLRAQTANRGRSHLQSAWVPAGSQNKSFGSILTGVVTSLFANFLPASQSGISQRSDEDTYGMMISAGENKFQYNTSGDIPRGFGQQWIAGSSKMMRKNSTRNAPYKLYTVYENGVVSAHKYMTSGGTTATINGLSNGQVGYKLPESTIQSKPGYRYGDAIGNEAKELDDGGYKNSEMMVQYSYYADENQKFPTKEPDAKSKKSVKEDLQNVIDKLKSVSDKLYNITITNDSSVVRSGNASTYGYDRLMKTKNNKSALEYPLGMLSDYRDKDIKMVDETVSQKKGTSYGLPTNGTLDSINTLTVLPKSALNDITNWSDFIGKTSMRGWTQRQWNAYKDDLIAFFFYDVVNENFIPFRATVKGIVESGNAEWDAMQFIGRGDKVYSYGGFNRSLAFSFQIVIGSIAEMAPTWQRISYLATLIKPANYTSDTLTMGGNSITNRFMVPPMTMITIGDLYRDQPVLLQTITTTIPEDAAWETLNNDDNSLDWNYLAKIVNSPNVLFGQLPREVTISVTLILLEKERAVVGGANFGSSYRDDTLMNLIDKTRSKMDDSMIVNVVKPSMKKPASADLIVSNAPSSVNPIVAKNIFSNIPKIINTTLNSTVDSNFMQPINLNLIPPATKNPNAF